MITKRLVKIGFQTSNLNAKRHLYALRLQIVLSPVYFICIYLFSFHPPTFKKKRNLSELWRTFGQRPTSWEPNISVLLCYQRWASTISACRVCSRVQTLRGRHVLSTWASVYSCVCAVKTKTHVMMCITCMLLRLAAVVTPAHTQSRCCLHVLFISLSLSSLCTVFSCLCLCHGVTWPHLKFSLCLVLFVRFPGARRDHLLSRRWKASKFSKFLSSVPSAFSFVAVVRKTLGRGLFVFFFLSMDLTSSAQQLSQLQKLVVCTVHWDCVSLILNS